MVCEEQKSTVRDKVECCDFLFFTRNDIFCDLTVIISCVILLYRSTKNEIYLFYAVKKLRIEKLGKTLQNVPSDDVNENSE